VVDFRAKSTAHSQRELWLNLSQMDNLGNLTAPFLKTVESNFETRVHYVKHLYQRICGEDGEGETSPGRSLQMYDTLIELSDSQQLCIQASFHNCQTHFHGLQSQEDSLHHNMACRMLTIGILFFILR
jgi:hypothetical protein